MDTQTDGGTTHIKTLLSVRNFVVLHTDVDYPLTYPPRVANGLVLQSLPR